MGVQPEFKTECLLEETMFTSEPSQGPVVGKPMAHEWRIGRNITLPELHLQERTLEPATLRRYSRTIFHTELSHDGRPRQCPCFPLGRTVPRRLTRVLKYSVDRGNPLCPEIFLCLKCRRKQAEAQRNPLNSDSSC